MLERAGEYVLERVAANEATDRIAVALQSTADGRHGVIRVTDDGPALSDAQREILEGSAGGTYDDPSIGFGLNVVRLTADTLDGRITCRRADEATTVELRIPCAAVEMPPGRRSATDMRAYGVPAIDLGLAVVAALLAGLAMGAVGQATTGVVPIIGALYGSSSAVVGWITHEFHSVVFGLAFAGVVASVPDRYADDWRWCLGIGTGWAVTLWLLAAGVVMPLWLRLVGIDAAVPNLSLPGLASHLVWGLVLGGGYAGGQQLLERAK